MLGFFGKVRELSSGTFRLRVDEVLAKGERVVVLCTESAQRGGHIPGATNIPCTRSATESRSESKRSA